VNGNFLSVGDTYTINEDWFGSLSAGFGDGAFYLPKYRVDASLSRKFLEQRNLVTTLGVGYHNAPTGYSDKNFALSAAYYFETPLILEGGVRVNYSTPGSVRTSQQFVAGTYGRNKEDLITGRYGWGSEGYLATTTSNQLVDFRSDEVSLAWRHWFAPATGWLVSANRYANPSYKRTGLNVGLFHDF
jgi:YaiO family outer membrane protein